MKLHKYLSMMTAGVAAMMLLGACDNDVEMRYPPKEELPDLPAVAGVHQFKAPLYWSVYEYCYDKEQDGASVIDITPDQWDEYIDWVADNLLPYGYDMVCTDGFCYMGANGEDGYMDQYGSIMLKDLVAKCKARGLKLGIYDNPLWLHRIDDTKVQGTDYTFQSLRYDGTDKVKNPDTADKWFTWIVAERPGAEEYIDGFFKHYKELGVEYIRMDFLSWYEDGFDRNMGKVGRGYGRASYARALYYIAKAANKYGIFTSLVMPHLYDDGIVEAQYGNMVRIVSDTCYGGWWHTSDGYRGQSFTNWPNCMNQFDGFVYWSHIAGRDKVILDGDFIRLNKCATDAEKETVISLQLMAGGPVTPTDQPSTVGDNVKFYTNTEMLALNADRFVGKPLSSKLNDANNQIWYGQMSDGSYVVGLFNRDDAAVSTTVKLSDLGIKGEWNARDLWKHADEGKVSESITASLPPRGCKIVKLTK